MEHKLKDLFSRRSRRSSSVSKRESLSFDNASAGTPPVQGDKPLPLHGDPSTRRRVSPQASPPHTTVDSSKPLPKTPTRSSSQRQRASLDAQPKANHEHNGRSQNPRSSLPALSSGLEQLSLGEELSSMIDPSLPRYSEDVADRNIERYSIDSPRSPSSVHTNKGHSRHSSRPQGQVERDNPSTAHPNGYGKTHRSSLSASSDLVKSDDGLAAGVQPAPDGSDDLDPDGARKARIQHQLNGVIDLSNTADTNVAERVAPAVVHEEVYPQVHEVREEQIHREIHNHHFYHRVQPVIETEYLPPKHYVPAPDGTLMEVTEQQVHELERKQQRRLMRDIMTKLDENYDGQHAAMPVPQQQPTTYRSPDGLERTETWEFHAPMLEDPSLLEGPVQSVQFDDRAQRQGASLHQPLTNHEVQDAVGDARYVSLQELTEGLQNEAGLIPEELVPPRRTSVRRKPVPPVKDAAPPPPPHSHHPETIAGGR